MRQALDRLRSALAANDIDAAVDAGHGLDLVLAASGAKAAAAYSELLAVLKALPQPQSEVGHVLVNIFQNHWDQVPADVLADARAFCEASTKDLVDAGAYQAMVELASGEWPGHRAGDV
jgi:HPt (histidine-containing phosphotransfer) domain-containing protein